MRSSPCGKVEKLIKKKIEDASLAELEEAVAYIGEEEAAQSAKHQQQNGGREKMKDLGWLRNWVIRSMKGVCKYCGNVGDIIVCGICEKCWSFSELNTDTLNLRGKNRLSQRDFIAIRDKMLVEERKREVLAENKLVSKLKKKYL